MPKSTKANKAAATAATTEAPATTEKKTKTRGAPKPYPPKSIIQRIARKKAGQAKGFQAAAYKLLQDLVVKYAINIFEQNQKVLANRKGKTLTPRDLQVLSGIAQTAATTPEKQELGAAVQAYENQIKNNPAYLKKKADRAKKREEKKAQKAAQEASQTTATATTTTTTA